MFATIDSINHNEPPCKKLRTRFNVPFVQWRTIPAGDRRNGHARHSGQSGRCCFGSVFLPFCDSSSGHSLHQHADRPLGPRPLWPMPRSRHGGSRSPASSSLSRGGRGLKVRIGEGNSPLSSKFQNRQAPAVRYAPLAPFLSGFLLYPEFSPKLVNQSGHRIFNHLRNLVPICPVGKGENSSPH